MSSRLLVILFVMLPGLLTAAVYKRVGPDGSVYYSDQPGDGGKAIKLPESTTYTPPPIPERYKAFRARSLEKQDEKAAGYTKVEITSPTQDSTLRSNAGNLPVSLRIQPGLRKGDVIRLVTDGKNLPLKITTPSLTLKNVDRGTHSLIAKIENERGKTLISSASVSFTLRRESILFPNRRPGKTPGIRPPAPGPISPQSPSIPRPPPSVKPPAFGISSPAPK